MYVIGNTVHNQSSAVQIPNDSSHVGMQLLTKFLADERPAVLSTEDYMYQQIRECL